MTHNGCVVTIFLPSGKYNPFLLKEATSEIGNDTGAEENR
jgi:hypothetical protein